MIRGQRAKRFGCLAVAPLLEKDVAELRQQRNALAGGRILQPFGRQARGRVAIAGLDQRLDQQNAAGDVGRLLLEQLFQLHPSRIEQPAP